MMTKQKKLKTRLMALFLAFILCINQVFALTEATGPVTVMDVSPLSQTEYVVDYGTKLAEVGLPDSLDITILDEETSETYYETAPIRWDGSYDRKVSGAYYLTAEFEQNNYIYIGEMPSVTVIVLSDGETIEYNGDLSLSDLEDLEENVAGAATEIVGTIYNDTSNLDIRTTDIEINELIKTLSTVTVTAFNQLAQSDYTVNFGTTLADIGLPSILETFVISQDGTIKKDFVEVEWLGEYNAEEAGTYSLTAAFISELYQYDGEMPYVTIKVLESNSSKTSVISGETTGSESVTLEDVQTNSENDEADILPVSGFSDDNSIQEDIVNSETQETPKDDMDDTAKDSEHIEIPGENNTETDNADIVIAPTEGTNEPAYTSLDDAAYFVLTDISPMSQDEDISTDKWSFSARYVKQADNYHVTETSDFLLKYQANFHSDLDDLSAEQVKIRIPGVLYQNRDGIDVWPSSYGIPEGEPGNFTYSTNSPFNYYKDGTDLVFWNYRTIEKGTTTSFQVLYGRQDIMKILDETTWTLTPEITITNWSITDEDAMTVTTGTTSASSTPLTGEVDTGVTLGVVSKQTYKLAGKSYTPGLYTQRQVERYISNPLPEQYAGENFDNYAFVVWQLNVTGSATQPWTLSIEDTSYAIGTEGEVDGTLVGYTVIRNNGGSSTLSGDTIVTGFSENKNILFRCYIVTAYPKETLEENAVTYNTANVTLHPYDGIDADQHGSNTAQWSWKNYEWDYTGNIIGVGKWVSNYNGALVKRTNANGGTTAFLAAKASDEDYNAGDFTITSQMRGYGYTHDTMTGSPTLGKYIDNSYYTLICADDVIYASGSSGKQQLLTSDDYYFSSISISSIDYGYDIYEDEKAACTTVDSVDQNLYVYAMFAGSEEWELIYTVPWAASGQMSYSFTQEQLSRQPWRVKAVHNAVDYETDIKMFLGLTLRTSSETINNLISNGTGELTINNLSAVLGDSSNFTVFSPDERTTGINYGNYTSETCNVDLYSFSEDFWANECNGFEVPMRENAIIAMSPCSQTAEAYKFNEAINDPAHGRILIDYSIVGTEGYTISRAQDYQSIRAAGEISGISMPKRTTIQVYDLLPTGTYFDPDVTPVAGRVTKGLDAGDLDSYKKWDTNQCSIELTDYITNYNGTGRNLCIFTLTYTGSDASVYQDNTWFEGFGVYFRAYQSWENLESISTEANIAAYMPQDGIDLLGTDTQVSLDDGSVTSEFPSVTNAVIGKDGLSLFGSDINSDGVTNSRNILYCAASINEDFAVAYTVGLAKYVHADSDSFNDPSDSAVVSYEEGYTYTLAATAADETSVTDITFFDQIENFDKNEWNGYFQGVDTTDAVAKGANSATIWYNASRDAVMPRNADASSGVEANLDLSNILTIENGWVRSTEWTNDLADVRSVAIQLHGLVLEGGETVRVGIRMKAPASTEVDNTDALAVWNEPHLLATVSDTSGFAVETTQFHDSDPVVVELMGTGKVEVIKQFASTSGVPASLRNQIFEITATRTTPPGENAYAYQPYDLYTLNDTGVWEKTADGLTTDVDGAFFLKAGQKAVFAVTGETKLSFEEETSVYWKTDYSETETNGTRAVTITNTYRPILYTTKNLSAVPSSVDTSNETFTFQIFLYDENSQSYISAAGRTYWLVEKAYTNGIIPTKIGEGILDENGCVTVKADDIIAVFADKSGQQFKVTEPVPGDDWYCVTNEASGSLGTFGTSISITNYYKWKDLLLQKAITNQDAEEAVAMAVPFTFQITNVSGTPVVGNRWVLLDSVGAETDTEGVLDENGQFTVACGAQTVKIEDLPANETFIVKETNSGETYQDTTGAVTVKMPIYSTSASATVTNDWLLRDLYVSKSIISNLEVRPFTISGIMNVGQSITVNYAGKRQYYAFTPTVSGSYTFQSSGTYDTYGILYDSTGTQLTYNDDGVGRNFLITYTLVADKTYYLAARLYTTSSSGIFTISVTTDLEIEDTNGNNDVNDVLFTFTLYDPDRVAASNKTYYINETVYTTDTNGQFVLSDGQTAYFPDIGFKGETWTISETPNTDYPQIYPADGASAQVTLIDEENKNLASFVNGTRTMLMIQKVWTAEPGDNAAESLVTSINDAGITTVPLYNGTDYGWNKAVPISLTVNGTEWPVEDTTVTILTASGTASSGIWEAGKPFWLLPGDTIYIAGLNANDSYIVSEADEYQDWWTTYNSDDNFVHITAVTGEISGTVNSAPSVQLENQVSTFMNIGARQFVTKLLTGDSTQVPDGAVLTWQTLNGDGVPKANVPYVLAYMDSTLYAKDSDGLVWAGERYLTPVIDESGAFILDADNETVPIGYLVESGVSDENGYIRIAAKNGYTPVVFFEETVSLTTDGLADLVIREVPSLTDSGWGGFVSTAESGDNLAFINSNIQDILCVQKALTEGTDAYDDFQFTVYQKDAEGYQLAVNTVYSVYDAETGALLSEGNTGTAGVITLKAGQYAEIETNRYTDWKVIENLAPSYILDTIASTHETDEISIETNSAIVHMANNADTISYLATYTGNDLRGGDSIQPDSYTVIRVTTDENGASIYEKLDTSAYDIRVTQASEGSFVQVITIENDETKVYVSQTAGPPLPAYAMLYSDGSFIFQRGNEPNPEKTLVARYTGFESASYKTYLSVPWYSKRSSIETVEFKDAIAPISTARWFYYCSNMTQIDAKLLDVSSVTDMSYMFYGCSSLTALDALSDWDVSRGPDMSYMFDSCSSLTTLDAISNWDVSSVTTMSYMFDSCSKLTTLDALSNWDVSSVTTMSHMFYGCSKLTTLDAISNWDVSSVTNMSYMFKSYSKRNALDALSDWDVSSVTNMSGMFNSCPSLTTLDAISNWDVSSVTNMSYMFYGCSSLTTLDAISDWNVSSVTDTSYMFRNCSKLTTLDGLSDWDVSSVTTMSYMFYGCSKLTTLDALSNWDVSSVTNMIDMFESCSSLTALDAISNWDVSSVTTMSYMFKSCSKLTALDALSDWDVSSVTTMSGMFESCSSLTTLDGLSDWDVSSVTTMSGMFQYCSKLTALDALSDWDVSSVTTMSHMFYGCSSLTTLDAISNWDVSSVTNMSYMFYGCSSLTTLDAISDWNVSSVTTMINIFTGVPSSVARPSWYS